MVRGSVVTDDAGETSYWFEYGPTAAYGSSTPHRTVQLEAYQGTAVSEPLTGLTRAKDYHHRLCAQDPGQSLPSCARDRVLRTQSVGCGETVTQDVTLTGTLDCRTAGTDGLNIGADGVTVELARNAILGPVPETASGTLRGIDNSGGHEDLQILNTLPPGTISVTDESFGRVTGWGHALYLQDAIGTTLRRYVTLQGTTGISVRGGGDTSIESVEIRAKDVGVRVEDSENFHLSYSQVQAGVSGVLLHGSVGVLSDALVSPLGTGAPSVGIEMAGDLNRVESGIARGWAVGNVAILSGDGNYVSDARVRGGILAGNQSDTGGARGDGLFVGPLATGTFLRNVGAEGNAGDGIEIQNADTGLFNSTGYQNGDFGIDAVPGVSTDEDGNGGPGTNSAGQNGNPLQCRNVFCQPLS